MKNKIIIVLLVILTASVIGTCLQMRCSDNAEFDKKVQELEDLLTDWDG